MYYYYVVFLEDAGWSYKPSLPLSGHVQAAYLGKDVLGLEKFCTRAVYIELRKKRESYMQLST